MFNSELSVSSYVVDTCNKHLIWSNITTHFNHWVDLCESILLTFVYCNTHSMPHVWSLNNSVLTETGGIAISPQPGPREGDLKPGYPMRPFFGVEPVLTNEEVMITHNYELYEALNHKLIHRVRNWREMESKVFSAYETLLLGCAEKLLDRTRVSRLITSATSATNQVLPHTCHNCFVSPFFPYTLSALFSMCHMALNRCCLPLKASPI